MIPSGVEIYLALEPIDLRWGFDRLCDVVREHVGRNARSGALFVFFGRRRDAVKVLFADRTSLNVLYKRLDQGTYRVGNWKSRGAASGAVTMSEREFDDLLDGIDIAPSRRKRTRH